MVSARFVVEERVGMSILDETIGIERGGKTLDQCPQKLCMADIHGV